MVSTTLRSPLALLVLVTAAVLEVGGDAVIRRGLRGSSPATVTAGALALAAYGVTVNLLGQDFSRTLGTYAGVFALTSVLAGKLVFGDHVSATGWLGLAVILLGCAILQYGTARS